MAALFVAFGQASTPAFEQAAPEHFEIRADNPTRLGFPIWVYGALPQSLTARYPFADDPRYFGSNRLELKRGADTLPPLPGFSMGGPVGLIEGSIAPATSPQNRLPLHLGFAITRPGHYSVRWTVMSGIPRGRVLAQSDWVEFEVIESPAADRAAWLSSWLAAPPRDTGQYVGDYLPSLLVTSSDPRVARVAIDGTYATTDLQAHCALGALGVIPEGVAASAVMDALRRRGPSSGIAYFISWHASAFQARRDEIVRTVLGFLRSDDDVVLEGVLRTLEFARRFDWRGDPTAMRDADRAVEAAAPALMSRSSRVTSALATYLPGIKSEASRARLWEQIDQKRSSRDQALIGLTWMRDPRDLPRIVDVLVAPGDPDRYGAGLSGVVTALIQEYGDAAIPQLRRALAESPYAFVKTQSAEQLALRGDAAAFRFFLDAVTENRFYKDELVRWLQQQFHLSPTITDVELRAFLNQRIKSDLIHASE